MRALVFTITLLALSSLAAAGEVVQQQSDDDIREKIGGTWLIDVEQTNVSSAKGTETYFADGRYAVVVSICFGGTTNVDNVQGTWGVTNGLLTLTIPRSSNDVFGKVLSGDWRLLYYRVIRVDDRELTIKGDAKEIWQEYTSTKKRSK